MDLSFDVILGAWIATGLTLFILSFLYEDNPPFDPGRSQWPPRGSGL